MGKHKANDRREDHRPVAVIELSAPISYPSYIAVEAGSCAAYYVVLDGTPPPLQYMCAQCKKPTDGKQCVFVGTADGFTHCLMMCSYECGLNGATRFASWMIDDGVPCLLVVDNPREMQRWPDWRPID